MPDHFRIVPTRLGYVGIVASPRGLTRVHLPEPSAAALRRLIRRDLPNLREDRRLLPELADALRRYFAGERVEFDVRLDCGDAPDFRADVWQTCLRVGYGKTVSYGELARRAGRPGAARAVRHGHAPQPLPDRRPLPPRRQQRRLPRRLLRPPRRALQTPPARNGSGRRRVAVDRDSELTPRPARRELLDNRRGRR